MSDDAPAHQIQAFHRRGDLTEAAIASVEDATAAAAPRPTPDAAVELLLPPPEDSTDATLVDAMAQRRTVRDPGEAALPLDRLSWLLGHAARASADGRRPHPSALATYPLQLDVVALRCDGLAAGTHRYAPDVHGLRTTATGDQSLALEAAFGRRWVRRARAVLVISADLGHAADHAGIRGYRYALLEAGHLAQNLLLLAAAVDLPACPLGGFADDALAAVVTSPEEEDEVVLYAVAL